MVDWEYISVRIVEWAVQASVGLLSLIVIGLAVLAVVEFIVDEIYVFVHSFDKSPAIGTKEGRWETVAVVRSSNNGYGSNQFPDVIVCDRTNSIDDPFEPHHTSFIHLVEIRRRNFVWKEIVVWRVSMLNGAQTSVATKHFAAFDSPFNRRFDEWRSRCFESRGVVFVIVEGSLRWRPGNLLFVYDTHNSKSAQFDFPATIGVERIGCVTCLQRMSNSNDEMNGWRIRLLAVGGHSDDQGNDVIHLAKYEMQLHEGNNRPAILDLSTMVVGIFSHLPSLSAVRTGDGMFGVLARIGAQSRILLYDHACNAYVFCAGMGELCKLDRSFAVYMEFERDISPEYVCPTVLNDRECILTLPDGSVVRMEINPPTLLYTAAKQIFRANPSLKSTSNAAQFRTQTGIDGMKAQFEL